jgi:hypothetical protein
VSIEQTIIAHIAAQGPITGADLKSVLAADSLQLWKACMLSPALELRTVGTRYLRLDRQVTGYARLSPSILREFLTYTVVGHTGDRKRLDRKAAEVTQHISNISDYKLNLARDIVTDIIGRLADNALAGYQYCCIIAGDIVYRMAHDVPRPERSTGKMVRGSDMDIIVVLEDQVPETLMRTLDESIYQQKYRALITPSSREEIDYIVKKMGRVKEQIAGDDFKSMVACKILQEGQLLCGSADFFAGIKNLLHDSGVTARLHAMEARAESFRREAVRDLLIEPHTPAGDKLYLFYTTEESEEFE